MKHIKHAVAATWYQVIGDYFWKCDESRKDEIELLLWRSLAASVALWVILHSRDLMCLVFAVCACFFARPLFKRGGK